MKFKNIFIMSILITGLFINSNETFSQRHRYGRGHSLDDKPKKLKIVTSFSDYASITNYLAGDIAEISHISHGDQDPHFVPPKPSYAMMLKDADMWITTGLDLEMWATALLDKARNKKIMDGEKGFVSVSTGIKLLQKPEKALDRTEGDIHIYGNPHIHPGPLNWKIIAENITIGLKKVAPEYSDTFEKRYFQFCDKVDIALFGDELIDMFGSETLIKMLENKTLFTFLEKEYKGEKLINKLGGWLKKALPFRGMKVIGYHKNWIYFAETFGLRVVDYIEPKPGIPPSAKHVQKVIKLIKDQNIGIMLVASYFEKNSPKMIENKTGIKAVFLPLSVGGIPEITNNFELIDYWIDQINKNIK